MIRLAEKVRDKSISAYRRRRNSSLSPRAIPVYWFCDVPNFGDDINPLLFARILGRPVRFSARKADEDRIIGMGSILAKPHGSGLVAGSGLINPASTVKLTEPNYLSVRGTHTADIVSSSGSRPRFLGDPMVLLDLVYRAEKRPRWKVGILPHHSTKVSEISAGLDRVRVIDPADPPMRVIDTIASCERIVSQSLHGLIVADVLGVPNLWWAPNDEMMGKSFKFEDYFSTVHGAKNVIEQIDEVQQVPESDFVVSNYKFDKRKYISALREEVASKWPI